jgi:hypothetical protein
VAATIETVVANVKSAVAVSIAARAKVENEKIMSAAPQPLGFVRHVDGVKDAPEETVKDGGVIVYDYNRLDQVAEFILTTLRERSPFRSGRYVRSHIMLLNGAEIDQLAAWNAGDVLSFVNAQPYARKIEAGGENFRTHPHVYETTAAIANRRFGNIANITFIYAPLPIGDVAKWAQTPTAQSHAQNIRGGKKDLHTEWLTRQPTITVREFR